MDFDAFKKLNIETLHFDGAANAETQTSQQRPSNV
jgi:hypothetical protein